VFLPSCVKLAQSPRARACPIASPVLAITIGYRSGDAALGDLGHVGAQALGKGTRRRKRRAAAARQDQPRRPVRRGDRQGHHAQRAAQQVADHHQPRHDREHVGPVQHLPDEAMGARTEGGRRIDSEQREQVLDLLADALGDGGQDEVVAAQFLDRYRPQGEDRVLGAGENGDRLAPKRLAHEAVGHGGLIEPPHDQVELARREQGQQLLRAPLL
jgi:hypothetical protein